MHQFVPPFKGILRFSGLAMHYNLTQNTEYIARMTWYRHIIDYTNCHSNRTMKSPFEV